MSDARVTVERADGVALITLCRPDKHNALDEAMWQGLDEARVALAASLPRAVLITGAGEAFCAGMDISPDNPQLAALATAAQQGETAPMARLLDTLRPVIDRLMALPVPIIAAINGLAYGGGAELGLRCDLRVMEPAAQLCLSEVRLGLMPDMGGTVALTRLVGPSVAADLILTGRKLGAEEALRLGVVNRVSEPGGAVAAARDLARAIAANGPRAVRAALDAIRHSLDAPASVALKYERDRAAALMASGECLVGVMARAGRTAPDFPDIEE